MDKEAKGILISGLAALFYAAHLTRAPASDASAAPNAKKAVDHAEALAAELEKRGHLPVEKKEKSK